jgi:methylmalonyl-CoA/ethylmalonyl-CoA epimerase
MQRIQIVQPLDDRSPHAVVLTNRGPGLSHTCYVVPALRERIASMKIEIDARLYRLAEFLDPAVLTAWAFFTESSLARYPIELIDDSSDSRDFFRLVDDAIGL